MSKEQQPPAPKKAKKQAQAPAKKVVEPTSTTAEAPQVPALLEDVNGLMAEILTRMEVITGQVEEVHRKRVTRPQEFDIDENSLLVRYRMEFIGGQGPLFKVEGSSSLPEVFSDEMLPEALKNIQQLINVQVLRPIMAKLIAHVNKVVVKPEAPVPGRVMGLTGGMPFDPTAARPPENANRDRLADASQGGAPED